MGAPKGPSGAVSRVGGRFLSTYDPEKALRVVEALAEGGLLRDVCRADVGMPSPATFRRWVVNNPDLALAVDAALRLSAASFEEEALADARRIAIMPKDGTHVRAVEVKIGQLRWSAERRDPARFGTRAQVNVKVPIQINTSLDMAQTGGGGVSVGGENIYSVSATVQRDPEGAIEEARLQVPAGKQLVPEERFTPRGKRILKPHDDTPFTRVMRGKQGKQPRHEGKGQHQELVQGGQHPEGGPGDEELHQEGQQPDPAHPEG